jgi:uncharacterized membrane protein YfcA
VLLVPLMAAAVGPTQSVGVLLPVLICGDIIAVARYHAHIEWRLVGRLLPWVAVGLVGGSFLLAYLRQSPARDALGPIMGGLVLALVVFQAVRNRLGPYFEEKMPHTWWFRASTGLLAGFTTGLAHLAGSVMNVYFLSMNLKKHSFMGSAAIFFMIVNVSKIPLYIPQGNINVAQFVFALKVILAVPVGAAVGMLLFNYIPQRLFNGVVLVLAAAAAVKLLWPYLAVW